MPVHVHGRDDISPAHLWNTPPLSSQNCNLKTLPENYDTPFYVQHLLNWPHLALVAEYLDPDASQSGRRDENRCWAYGAAKTHHHLP